MGLRLTKHKTAAAERQVESLKEEHTKAGKKIQRDEWDNLPQ